MLYTCTLSRDQVDYPRVCLKKTNSSSFSHFIHLLTFLLPGPSKPIFNRSVNNSSVVLLCLNTVYGSK